MTDNFKRPKGYSYTKKYSRELMREYRKKNPLSQKKYAYVVEVDDKKYIFLNRTDVNLKKVDVKDPDFDLNAYIKCF